MALALPVVGSDLRGEELLVDELRNAHILNEELPVETLLDELMLGKTLLVLLVMGEARNLLNTIRARLSPEGLLPELDELVLDEVLLGEVLLDELIVNAELLSELDELVLDEVLLGEALPGAERFTQSSSFLAFAWLLSNARLNSSAATSALAALSPFLFATKSFQRSTDSLTGKSRPS
jgi:hypothetical protein